MKKIALCILCVVFCCACGVLLSGCFFIPTGPTDFNADVQVVAPGDIPSGNFVVEDGKEYYTSPGLSLWMEVNGAFFSLDYFYLDGTKRVYDNLYLYQNDYFYMLSDDMRHWFSDLAQTTSAEFAEVETESGESVQINVKKSGIYTLTFDVETKLFDLQFKGEIDTPVYHKMQSCSVYTEATDWVPMSVSPSNADEFVLENFHIDAGQYVSFFSSSHTSYYKVTLDETLENKIAHSTNRNIAVDVGGNYNVYVNAKTYVVRLQLVDANSATYSCVYHDGTDFVVLQPYEADVPYVFRLTFVVDTKYTTSLPKFYTSSYNTYDLTVVQSDLLSSTEQNHYFKNPGTYSIVVNLQTFQVSVELMPQ